MKVVFLDFDGVLNYGEWLDKVREQELKPGEPEPLSMQWWANALDPYRVGLLNELLQRTGAKVVVSSSWRVGTSESWLQRVLEIQGFEGTVIGKTERCYGYPRAFEIQRWLNPRQITKFVILDDDYRAGIEGHFVRTHYEVGLTRRHIEKAVTILGEVPNGN